MKITFHHALLLSIFKSEILKLVGAQPPPGQPYSTFTPSIAIIISILIAALVFMLFFSIYVRHCAGDTSVGVVRRGVSLRSRRAVVARGLDASVIETFPTFSYSEVKDHHIGFKDALECAVCLNEFEDEETLLLIPKCDHVFHPECIGAWLEAHVTCPVCRADLVPGEEPVQVSTPVLDTTDGLSEEVVIRMEEDELDRARVIERNMSLEDANRAQRSWSVRMFGFEKYRSRSTGHSLVRPGENLERFTLRLPVQVRKEMLNRTGSRASLPREGYIGDGSGRIGRSYRRFDREGKSDRWVFFGRGSSMKSPKNAVEMEQAPSHGGSSSSRRPVKMPSFRCLEPKAADETGLASQDQLARNLE